MNYLTNMNLLAESSFNFQYLLIAILLGLLIGTFLSRRGKVDKSKIQALSVKDFMDMKRKGTLVDIRKKELYEKGKIVGAKNYKGGSGSGYVRQDIPIFIYDQAGRNAYSAAKKYVKDGAVMVYFMNGGYEAYLKEKEGKDVK